MEQVWNGYGTDTQLNITFQLMHSMVWNGGVWNGIRGLDPELWIGVWIGMCARPCSGPFILSGSHIYKEICTLKSLNGSSETSRTADCLFRFQLQLLQDIKKNTGLGFGV